MKPFLILQIRPVDAASDTEFEAFLNYGDLSIDEVKRVRLEKTGLPEIDLDSYSAVIVGGGPSMASDPKGKQPDYQIKFDKQLYELFDKIIEKDFPYLGACYGLCILAMHQGGEVSREKYAEAVEGLTIKINEEGEKDSLLQGLPTEFRAFAGHKEACQEVPPGATLLASSDTCPVHLIRFKKNIYATQFHPELDVHNMLVRTDIYKDKGYFPIEDAEKVKQGARDEGQVTIPQEILKRFVEKYRS